MTQGPRPPEGAGAAGARAAGARGAGEPCTVRLCLLGFGSVARAFCELLAARERQMVEEHGLRVLVSAAGTRHGSLLAPEGLPAGELLARASAGKASPAGGLPASGSPAAHLPEPPRPAPELLAASQADLLVELTVMERDSAPVATAHIETAFALGIDVVTANKGPIAWNWPHVAEKARAAGRRIRFESTVMDGLPVFSLLELALPGCRLLGFEAVFNATTNSIIEAMADGRSLDEALRKAQAAGIAEADPSYDLDGWDAACKAAALANVAMDARITPADVDRVSLRDVPPQRIRRARAEGRRLRLVTTVWREPADAVAPGGAVRARTRAVELDIDHPLAHVGAEALGAVLHTDLMNDVLVSELQGHVAQTAYGVYADLLYLCRES